MTQQSESAAQQIYAHAVADPAHQAELDEIRSDERMGDPQFGWEVGQRAAHWADSAIRYQRRTGGEDIPATQDEYYEIIGLVLKSAKWLKERVTRAPVVAALTDAEMNTLRAALSAHDDKLVDAIRRSTRHKDAEHCEMLKAERSTIKTLRKNLLGVAVRT